VGFTVAGHHRIERSKVCLPADERRSVGGQLPRHRQRGSRTVIHVYAATNVASLHHIARTARNLIPSAIPRKLRTAHRPHAAMVGNFAPSSSVRRGSTVDGVLMGAETETESNASLHRLLLPL
jgi:hypothetical protein